MDLNAAVAALQQALAAGEGIVPAAEIRSAEALIDDIVKRRQLAEGHTVVALVGGTGSGKSSLFNLLTESSFADAGVKRPTTRMATAAHWGKDATELLDYLGIAPQRRLYQETPLTLPSLDTLTGLVLLDLPDQDSLEEGHAGIVDQLVPVVDLLVWMVDPQKYADNVLHEHYLGPLRARADSMLLVVNHADTLTEAGLATVAGDIRRLLDQAGLQAVDVHTASVIEGRGTDEIWRRIVHAHKYENASDATALTQISFLATYLLRRYAAVEPELAEAVAPTVDALMRVSGAAAVAESLEQSVGWIGGGHVPQPEPPAPAVVLTISSGWASNAKKGLSKRWAGEVDRALPSVEVLSGLVGEAVRELPIRAGRVRSADVLAAFAAVFGLFSVGAGIAWLFAGAQYIAQNAGLAALLALVFWGSSVWLRRRIARQRAAAYLAAARASLTDLVDRALTAPVNEVLGRHRQIRTSLQAVQV